MWNRCHKARFTQHRFLHECVAGADSDAMATGDAARAANLHPSIPENAWAIQFPANRKGLIHFYRLAGLYTLPAEDTLARVIAIERVGHVHFIRFWREGVVLMLNVQLECRVVDPAILVVVVADRAVEHMVAENHIERLRPRILGTPGVSHHILHAGGSSSPA